METGSNRDMVTTMIKIDNGAPAHNPMLQDVVRTWEDTTVETDEGTRPAQRAVYQCVDKTLDAVKTALKRKVDDDAEAARLRYVTPGAGMAMTYSEKHAQARAVLALGEAGANALTEAERQDQFPVLAVSVGIEASTLWACAGLVIARYEAFADIAGVIERTRLLGKKAISDASDAAGARAAYGAIAWTV